MRRPGRSRLLERLDGEALELLEQVGRIAAARGGAGYLVGGPVRDLLLDRPTLDLDVVVEGDGIVVAQELARAYGATLTRYRDFGTARLDLPGGRRIDVATARSEVYPKAGQLPRVARGTLRQDLARRDFTINAMAVALAPDQWGRLADPYEGRRDLQARLVRILHERSFADDPTRMLRALRFALRFDFALEQSTARALADGARGRYLEWLSGDRLRRELAKLFEEAPVAGPCSLAHHGLLVAVHPGLEADAQRLERLLELMRRFGIGAADAGEAPWREEAAAVQQWSLVLASVARGLTQQQRWALARRLRLTRPQRQPLIDAGAAWRRALARLTEAGQRPAPSAAARALDDLCLGAVLVGLAELEGGPAEVVQDYLRRGRWVTPTVSGRDLAELGLTEGPAVGEVLARLRAAWLDGEVRDARAFRWDPAARDFVPVELVVEG